MLLVGDNPVNGIKRWHIGSRVYSGYFCSGWCCSSLFLYCVVCFVCFCFHFSFFLLSLVFMPSVVSAFLLSIFCSFVGFPVSNVYLLFIVLTIFVTSQWFFFLINVLMSIANILIFTVLIQCCSKVMVMPFQIRIMERK